MMKSKPKLDEVLQPYRWKNEMNPFQEFCNCFTLGAYIFRKGRITLTLLCEEVGDSLQTRLPFVGLLLWAKSCQGSATFQ